MHCQPYFRRLPARRRRASTSYTPAQVAAIYSFPKVAGVTADPVIAIGELGGGYSKADITSYFQSLGLPAPVITDLSVRGASNSPGSDADAEVMLDILCAAAAYSYCTGRPAQVLMVWAPNDGMGMSDAQNAALASPLKPAVFSWSWGAPEDGYGSTSAMEAVLEACAAAGMTTLAAAGDNGSGDGETGNHVDYPASSPYVLGCGGTSLQATAGGIQSEGVWNDGASGGSTGGGVSSLFPVPSWQAGSLPSGTKGRGVPDWSGDADPETGYSIVVDGQPQVIGGTSAVAPLFAGLVAALGAAVGKRLGLLQPLLYAHAHDGTFRDITQGNNGGFAAGIGYDFDSGLGVPVGTALLAALQASSPTPVPTPTPTPTPTPIPIPVPTPTPTPVPVPAGPTLAQAIAAANGAVAAVVRSEGFFGQIFAARCAPAVDAALTQLWSKTMSLAALHAEMQAHEQAHSLPPGLLAGLTQDFLQLVVKWWPTLLEGATPAQAERMQAEFAALTAPHEQAHGLGSGLLAGILQGLLPTLLQQLPGLLGGLLGGLTGGPKPAPAA